MVIRPARREYIRMGAIAGLALAACQGPAIAPIRPPSGLAARGSGQVPVQLFQRVPGSLVVRLEQAALRRSVQAFADVDTHSAVVFRLANPARLKQDLVVAAASGAGAYQATFADLPADEIGGYTLTASLWRDIASASVLTDPGYQDPDRLVGLGSATASIVPGESRTVALTIHAVGAPVLRYKGWVVAPEALSAGLSGLECDTGVSLAGNPLGTLLEFETFFPGASSLLASASLPVASWPTSPATATFSLAVPDTTEASTSFRARLRLSGATGPFSVRSWPLVVSRLVVSGTSPATGSAGTSVTLEGAGFSPVPAENTVTFGGIAASVASASTTRLTVTVPSWAGNDVQVGFAGVSATQSFTAASPRVFLHAGAGTSGSTDGPATLARFYGPSSVISDGSGGLFVADTNNNRIRKIAPTGEVSTWINPLLGAYGLAMDSAGRLYVSTGSYNKIWIYSKSGSLVDTRTFAARQNAMCIDRDDYLYVSDGANQIKKYHPSGTLVTTYGSGATTPSGDGGQASTAGIPDPTAICLDGHGNLYVVERSHHRVRKIDPNGIISTFAGTGTSGNSGDGGPAREARLSLPSGVAVDRSGNVLIVDAAVRIRRVDPSGIIRRVAGDNSSPNLPNLTGLDPLVARFSFIRFLSMDSLGNLYMGDVATHLIYRLSGL